MDIKGFEHWWKLLAGAGVAMAVASITAGQRPGIIVGLGLLGVGTGEWISHPLQTQLGHGFQITGYPRRWKVAGTGLSLAGGALLLYGLGKLLLA